MGNSSIGRIAVLFEALRAPALASRQILVKRSSDCEGAQLGLDMACKLAGFGSEPSPGSLLGLGEGQDGEPVAVANVIGRPKGFVMLPPSRISHPRHPGTPVSDAPIANEAALRDLLPVRLSPYLTLHAR